jgi:hypothetical protein
VRRRLGIALLATLLGAATPSLGRAQDTTRVLLDVSLATETTTPSSQSPVIRVRYFFRDSRWTAMLQSGFPLRIHYRVELWRSRGAWFDATEREVEWDVAVRHEPLLDQYTVVRLTGRARQENRYATQDALAAAIGRSYRVTMAPTEVGEYYYVASIQVTTLSDTDLDELERFFVEDVAPAAEGRENVGSAVGRGAKRLVLKLAGLPSLRLETRSEKFRVGSTP